MGHVHEGDDAVMLQSAASVISSYKNISISHQALMSFNAGHARVKSGLPFVTWSPSFSSSSCLSLAVVSPRRSAAAARHRPLQVQERTADPELRNSLL